MNKRKIITAAVLVCSFLVIGLIYFFKRLPMEPEADYFAEAEMSSSALQTEAVTEEDVLQEETENTQKCWYVYISGAVNNPGVYEMQPESRVFQVIVMAGGLRSDADERLINQAEAVYDGQHIDIPAIGETTDASESFAESTDGKIDINKADAAALMTLPGIGEAKAEAIIAYRNSCGGFKNIEEIQNVAGIKSSLFEQIKDKIKVL